jgi:hypothetical protein
MKWASTETLSAVMSPKKRDGSNAALCRLEPIKRVAST